MSGYAECPDVLVLFREHSLVARLFSQKTRPNNLEAPANSRSRSNSPTSLGEETSPLHKSQVNLSFDIFGACALDAHLIIDVNHAIFSKHIQNHQEHIGPEVQTFEEKAVSPARPCLPDGPKPTTASKAKELKAKTKAGEFEKQDVLHTMCIVNITASNIQ